MIKRYCIGCKETVEKDQLSQILVIRGSRENSDLVGVCRECYPEWHAVLLDDEEDQYVNQLIDEGLEKLGLERREADDR